MAWTTLADKITVGILMFLFSGIFGCLPMVLAAKCGLQADHPPTQRSKRKWKNVILAFLLNFGGGILSANAFCHWLPENVEAWEKLGIKSKLPMVEVITLAGFFFICIMEEVLHHFLHPHEPKTDSNTSVDSHQEKKGFNNNGLNLDEFKRYDKRSRDCSNSPPESYKVNNSITDYRPHNEPGCKDYKSRDERGDQSPKISIISGSHDHRVQGRNSGVRTSQRRPSYMFDSMSGDSSLPRGERRVSKMLSGDGTESGLQTKSAIRTFFVVAALSFHSVIEGMAITLEDGSTEIWTVFLAVSMHKYVIAFSLGVELLAAESRKLIYLISIGVFSFAPLIGVAIGIILTEVAYEDSVNQTAVQCIQAIATGTIIYVVFFEIFPKGKEIGGTGFQHVVAMTAGFLAFLPTLLLHDESEHEKVETTTATAMLKLRI